MIDDKVREHYVELSVVERQRRQSGNVELRFRYETGGHRNHGGVRIDGSNLGA